jgi:hypothetical protein
MICKRCLSGVSLTFLLAAAPTYSEEVTAPAEFTYTDDWSLVSAPPPPGPYSAIHIDPRVPGHDSLPPLPAGNQPQQSWEEVEEKTTARPPAAGAPDSASRDRPMQLRQAPQRRPQPRMRQQQRAYDYPVPGHYPGRANYPGYGNMPPSGYYGSPYPNQADEVPPPPVYDEMMRRSGAAW